MVFAEFIHFFFHVSQEVKQNTKTYDVTNLVILLDPDLKRRKCWLTHIHSNPYWAESKVWYRWYVICTSSEKFVQISLRFNMFMKSVLSTVSPRYLGFYIFNLIIWLYGLKFGIFQCITIMFVRMLKINIKFVDSLTQIVSSGKVLYMYNIQTFYSSYRNHILNFFCFFHSVGYIFEFF